MASGQRPQRRHRRNRSDPVYSNYSYEHILVGGAVPLGVGQYFNVAGGGAGYDEEDLGLEEAEVRCSRFTSQHARRRSYHSVRAGVSRHITSRSHATQSRHTITPRSHSSTPRASRHLARPTLSTFPTDPDS